MARIVIHHTRARGEAAADSAKFVRQVLREIQFQARVHLATGPYTHGHLASTLKARGPFFEFNRVSGSVGSDEPYAASVEGGSGLYGPQHRKYYIFPDRKTHLRFYWRKVGRVVTLPYVQHPGQKGKGYLRKAAQSVGRRHNMIVIIHEL